MLSLDARKQYVPTIGIECHVQLKTKTKLFAAVANDARGAAPNSLISYICLGMPGALPVFNEQVLYYALQVAFAFNTAPQRYSYFERKHYFYPDLPKGYQITQLEGPIIKGGYVEIDLAGTKKRVQINRVQIEEDAGKSQHPAGKDYSLVDLNRAGTPLLEIVSEADMHSAEEAKAYARELWLLMRYTDVSDADLYHGNMRFDVNVSVSKDANRLGLRTETKNLNSFRSVERAIEYEVGRQIELLEKGQTIVQETRGWDDAKQKTFSQRSKEDAHDYRYFPEPDIPPIELTDAMIARAAKTMPTLPGEYRLKLSRLGFSADVIETILDKGADDPAWLAMLDGFIHEDPSLAAYVAKFELNDLPALEKDAALQPDNGQPARHALTEDQYRAVYRLVKENKINSTKSKALLFSLKSLPAETNVPEYAAKNGYLQVSDKDEISQIVAQVLADNPKAAQDIQNGEAKAIGFLVGQVMKVSQGKANPSLAQKLIKEQLSS